VREALTRFITAFDDLDWDTFRLSFDDNATVFYPRGFPERASGRTEFEEAEFEQIRGARTAGSHDTRSDPDGGISVLLARK